MPDNSTIIPTNTVLTLAEQIRALGLHLGFQEVRFSRPSTETHKEAFGRWLEKGYHGDMAWLTRNNDKRFDAAELHPGTKTVITVRMDYWPNTTASESVLANGKKAYISRYALGRDYHKVLRKRLTQFAKEIQNLSGEHGARPFVDSAPVMERQLAEQSGLGWIGKNTLLLSPGNGSWFFLGELCTNLDIPADPATETGHCGTCQQCLVDCPTDAFVEAGVLDARKCISYLTIEYSGSIPIELRPKMGNRIYGCDDCQLVCPHNRKVTETIETDFSPRHQLDDISLLELFSWNEATFLSNTEGSPIRRIGHEQWQRNIAVALGNGPSNAETISALNDTLPNASELLAEHIQWALNQLEQ
jgi:epoxyqueuosine reductase